MDAASDRAVLFDIDGTLVDTNYLHVLAWRRVFLERNEPEITCARIHRLVGMGSDELLETLCGRPRPELKAARARQFDALKPDIQAFPLAGDLLRALHDRGVRVVLATSAEKSDLRCVAVTTGGVTRAELEAAGAVAVYDDVAALLDGLDESPLVRPAGEREVGG